MSKHPWEKAWENKKFEIKTLQPSVIVERHKDKFYSGDAVLDVGSGNGRNSIYLAGLGCKVDSFDVSDMGWTDSLDPDLKEKISFTKSDIMDYPYAVGKYKAVIMARVIQYLDREELNYLLDKTVSGLDADGFLLLSYTSQGGIFDQDAIDVPKYNYSIEDVEKMLRDRFKTVEITAGANKNTHVNYDGQIVSYDIYAAGVINEKI